MMQSWFSRTGALLARGGFNVLRQKMDPRHSNGAPFLGLNGIAIKSHGGTDAIGFASAIDVGYEMAESGLVARLAAVLDTFHGRLAAPGPQLSSG
jgi:glycerol-3-phosphate acyltransferase PlsX